MPAEPSKATVELPPELCHLIIAPISVDTVYSYSFAPSIIHRLESLLLAANLKRMLLDHCILNSDIPTMKVRLSCGATVTIRVLMPLLLKIFI